MTRLDITKATRLLYRRLNLRMVARRSDLTDWTCDRTGQSFTFTDTEIAQLIGDDQAAFQGMGGSFEPDPTPDPEDIREADKAAAFRRLEYVEAVRAAALPKRAKINLFEEVIAAVAARLEDHRVPSSRSVKRWDAKAGDPPNPYRLIDDHSAKGNRTDRITDAQRELIDRMIDHYHLRPTRPSVDSLVAMVRDEVKVRNAALTDDLKMAIPGRRAIETVLHERNPQTVDAARYGQAWAHQKHGAVDRQADPEAPLDRVELDHTRADIFLVSEDDHLPIGRPTIGFAIDRCTRMPLGLYVGFEEPSVLTVMQILKHTILPKTYVAQMVESGEWDLRHRWDAWGTPRTIVLDRAREKLGRDLRPSLRELGVRDVIFAAAKQGRQKGAVERHFRTLNRKLLHEQKGTTFSNIGDRGDYDPRKHAVLTLSEPRTDANFVPAFEFGTRLHVGDRFQIQPWFEAGFIGTVRHADGAVLVRRADFDALLIRVRDLPDGGGDDRDYASSVEINNRRGGIYRQRYMLEDVLSGTIRSRPAGNGAEGMKARLLHRSDFERQRMLCKTAIQIINDEFVRLPSYLPALWNRGMPTKNAIAKLRDDGRVRAMTGSWGVRLPVRDLVRTVQDDGDRRMFVTDPVELADVEHMNWRAILADSLCAKIRS